MNSFQQRVSICGFHELDNYQSQRISYLISVSNPGAASSKPAWFNGSQLQLWFGDVISEADAKRCKTRAPSHEDIQNGLECFGDTWRDNSKILVSCDYGASRSPALAYVFIADQLGKGREAEAFRIVMDIRPIAVPNGLVIRLGDALLERRGALLQPVKEFYAKINAEIAAWRAK